MRQGSCLWPTDEHGRVCDRLAGLEKVIDPEAIRQVLSESGRVNPRACRLTHEVMLWIVLAMGLFTDLPIRQVFKQTRRGRLSASVQGQPGRTGNARGSRLCRQADYDREKDLNGIVVRALMFEAATRAGLDPDALSFTGCFQILKCRLPEIRNASRAALWECHEALLWEMSCERLESRRNRISPRVIKQKMSKWPKKRPNIASHRNCRKPLPTRSL